MEVVIPALGVGVALVAALFALWQARAAKIQAEAAKIQAEATRVTLERTSRIRLFSSFDLASQVTIERPELLYSVHGLSHSVPLEEARNIAYFSLLLDAFQHFYGESYNGDFDKMQADLVKESTFLNRLLAVRENQERWHTLKAMYYGQFDLRFVQAIEGLIEHERNAVGGTM